MAGEDTTLKLGGDSKGLVDAVKQGGEAFRAFIEKSGAGAEDLAKKPAAESARPEPRRLRHSAGRLDRLPQETELDPHSEDRLTQRRN